MSHYCVYVFHDAWMEIDELLAKYSEHLSIPHKVGTVSDIVEKYKNRKNADDEGKTPEQLVESALDWFGYYKKGDDAMSDYNPDAKWDWYEEGGRFSDLIAKNNMMLKQLDKSKIPTPYAFVKPDGEWVGRGKVGWFGMASDEQLEAAWENTFRDYLDSASEDLVLTQVDCHI